MKYLKAFGRFWLEFIFGDDWVMAATVILTLIMVSKLAQVNNNAWYLLPFVAILSLTYSVLATHKNSKDRNWQAFVPLGVVAIALASVLIPSINRAIFGGPESRQPPPVTIKRFVDPT